MKLIRVGVGVLGLSLLVLIAQMVVTIQQAKLNENLHLVNNVENNQQILHSILMNSLLTENNNANEVFRQSIVNLAKHPLTKIDESQKLQQISSSFLIMYEREKASISERKAIESEIARYQKLEKYQFERLSNLVGTDGFRNSTKRTQFAAVLGLAFNSQKMSAAKSLEAELQSDAIVNAYALRLLGETINIARGKSAIIQNLKNRTVSPRLDQKYVEAYKSLSNTTASINKTNTVALHSLISPVTIILNLIVIVSLMGWVFVETKKMMKAKYLRLSDESTAVIDENQALIELITRKGGFDNQTFKGTTGILYQEFRKLSEENEVKNTQLDEQKTSFENHDSVIDSLVELKSSMGALEEKLVNGKRSSNEKRREGPSIESLVRDIQTITVAQLEMLHQLDNNTGVLELSSKKVKQSISTIHLQIGSENDDAIESTLDELSDYTRTLTEAIEAITGTKAEFKSLFENVNDLLDSFGSTQAMVNTALSEKATLVERLSENRVNIVQKTIASIDEIIKANKK